MKVIVSFLIASALLSASTSTKLSVGDAALSDKILCKPVDIFTPPTPIPFEPQLKIPTTSTIRCELPVVPKCPAPLTPPSGPICPTPEPRTYALLGGGLLVAGLVRRFKK